MTGQNLSVSQQRHSPIAQLSEGFEARKGEYAKLFKDEATADRFVRIIRNTIAKRPDLVEADKASLFEAAMDCANCELMPDGKQGAFVVYNAKVKGPDGRENWIKKVQFLTMVKGVIEILYRTGRVSNVIVDVIYKGEFYDIQRGDDPRLDHKPDLEIRNTAGDNDIIAAYCVVVTKDGAKHMKVLSRKKIDKARKAAKSDNVWSNHFDEMAMKTAIHSVSKVLPFAVVAIEKESAFYDFDKPQVATMTRTVALTHNPADRIEEPTAPEPEPEVVKPEQERPEPQKTQTIEKASQRPVEAEVKSEAPDIEKDEDAAPDKPEVPYRPVYPVGVIGAAMKAVDKATQWANIVSIIKHLETEKTDAWNAAKAIGEDAVLYRHIKSLPVWDMAFPGSPYYPEIAREGQANEPRPIQDGSVD